jgi:hypothetical protein
MDPICNLFLVTLLASAPAIAEPLDKFQVDAGAEKIQVAEQRIVCPIWTGVASAQLRSDSDAVCAVPSAAHGGAVPRAPPIQQGG